MNARVLSLTTGLSVALFFAAAQAGEYEDGMTAYRARDYQRARMLWTPLAMQGQRRAQVSLARMLERGEGGSPDLGGALGWYKQAAEQNHAESQYRVAMAHAYGHRKSARLLAQAYRTGELGLTPDSGKAQYWQTVANAKKNR